MSRVDELNKKIIVLEAEKLALEHPEVTNPL